MAKYCSLNLQSDQVHCNSLLIYSIRRVVNDAASDVLGPTFNITQVHRDHMGVYVCGKVISCSLFYTPTKDLLWFLEQWLTTGSLRLLTAQSTWKFIVRKTRKNVIIYQAFSIALLITNFRQWPESNFQFIFSMLHLRAQFLRWFELKVHRSELPTEVRWFWNVWWRHSPSPFAIGNEPTADRSTVHTRHSWETKENTK